MQLINRKDAKTQGLKWFYTGKACKHGHVAERVVSSKRCRVCLTEYNKKHREENPERHKEFNRRHNRLWRLKNPDKRAAAKAKRRAAKLQRTPQWVDFKAIQAFYDEAHRLTKETGIKHVVDHVHPLQGDIISGLHVPENLQVSLVSDNCRKKNKFTPYDYYRLHWWTPPTFEEMKGQCH